ncbi:MAG: PTS system mannose/fructose/sorbose family transporter subunit IID [Anaerolineales bacterium]|nr:MAG: PTS system mannose/fructose/sorbose family transporter subunit IID [Anaerolineales bacterium]
MAEKKLTRADLRSAFWRYFFTFQFGWNYERMQSVSYAFALLPILKKTRPDPEEFKEAFLTNLNFFNTNPVVGAPLIMGAHIALEEAGASLETTEGLKVGLMGPLAGVGDALVWALYNSIVFSIGSVMALEGNIMGPILTFLLVFFPYLAVRYWQFFWAYDQGTNLIAQLGSGAIQRITELATLVGLIVVGGFAPSIVRLTTPLKWEREVTVRGETVMQTIALQEQLDKVLPYLLPVGLTLLVYWLLKRKGWTPIRAIGLLIVIGFLGGALGIFG